MGGGSTSPLGAGGSVSQVTSCVRVISISRSYENSYRLPGLLSVIL